MSASAEHRLLRSRLMRASLAFFCLGLLTAALAGCAADAEGEDVASSDAALAAEWGEIDEDATPIDEASYAEAAAQSDAEGDVDDSVAAIDDDRDIGDGAADVAASATATKAACNPETSLTLAVYYEVHAADMLAALKKHAAPCSSYYVAVPKVGGSPAVPDAQLYPRRVVGKGVHAYGDAFHATAEVHWGASRNNQTGERYPGWKSVEVIKKGPGQYETREVPKERWFKVSWYLKGVLFRQRMAKRGYRPQNGDTWHINELESAWTRTVAQQRAIRDLVRGLADGDPEYDAATDPDPEVASKSAAEKAEITKAARFKGLKGVVYVSSLGKRLPGETSDAGWRDALKQTLRRKRFWADMAANVEHFALERYLNFGVCNASDTLDEQAAKMGELIENLPLIAKRVPRYETGPRKGESPVATALFYLGRHYTPVVSSAWTNEQLSTSDMQSFVSGEIMAARRFANENRFSDGRIGVYWRPKRVDGVDPAKLQPDNDRLADRVATVLNVAYDGKDGRALDACGAGGAACKCGR
jgi:hypothetical protein